ncbi:MAG: hypothetical protein H6633_32440 [Anaerolineales bacterium]|nr:hypothetical protein [Anaerolineales bacterium]
MFDCVFGGGGLVLWIADFWEEALEGVVWCGRAFFVWAGCNIWDLQYPFLMIDWGNCFRLKLLVGRFCIVLACEGYTTLFDYPTQVRRYQSISGLSTLVKFM